MQDEKHLSEAHKAASAKSRPLTGAAIPTRGLVTAHDMLSLDEGRIYQLLNEVDQPDWQLLRGNRSWSEKWVVFFLARQRPVPREAIQDIFQNQLLRRHYPIVRALLSCRYTPASLGMNLVQVVRWGDLLTILREPYLNGAVRHKMETHLVDQMKGMALGQKITIAKQAPRGLVKHLRFQQEVPVLRKLFQNCYFTYDDALFMASHQHSQAVALGELAVCTKWNQFKEIRVNLLRHPNTPHSVLLTLTLGLGERDLLEVLSFPQLQCYPKRLVERVLEEGFHLNEEEIQKRADEIHIDSIVDLTEIQDLEVYSDLSDDQLLKDIWVKWE